MKKWITAVSLLTLSATLALAAPQEAKGPGGPPPEGRRGRPDMVAMLAEKLSLTDAQKQQVTAIHTASQEANAEFLTTSRATMKKFFDARQANDTATMDSLKPAMDTQRAKMKEIRDAEMAKILPLLTAEQKATWDKMEAERAAQKGQHEQHEH